MRLWYFADNFIAINTEINWEHIRIDMQYEILITTV